MYRSGRRCFRELYVTVIRLLKSFGEVEDVVQASWLYLKVFLGRGRGGGGDRCCAAW